MRHPPRWPDLQGDEGSRADPAQHSVMKRSIKVLPLRSALRHWVIAWMLLSAGAELAYQGLVAIPTQAVIQQSATADRILSRQSESIAQALEGGRLDAAEAALRLESTNPDLRWLALVDPQGRVALATPPAWAKQMAHRTLEGLEAPDGTGPSPWVHVDAKADLLTAARPIAAPHAGPGGAVPGTHGPAAAAAEPGRQASAGSLYLALELGTLRGRLWAQRLAFAGWIPWLIGAVIALVLTAHLTERQIRRPLRRLLALAGPRAPSEADGEPGLRGRGELAELAASLERLGRRVQDLESRAQALDRCCRFALEGASEGIWDWDLGTQKVFYSPRFRALLGLTQDASAAETEADMALETWLARVHPDDLGAWRSAMERQASGLRGDFICEHRLLVEDGGWRWMVARGQALDLDPEGRPKRLLGTLADISDRKAAERSLAYLVNLETVLLESSRALSAAQPEAVEGVIERVLGALARRMYVECACLFTLGAEGRELHATYTWGLMEGPCQLAEVSPVSEEQLPRWMETLRHGEDIRIGNVFQLPEAWGQDRELLAQVGVQSVLAVPLRAGERLAGFVSLELSSAPRDWRESEVRALRLLADLIGAAFERRKLERELMESRQRQEEIALYDGLTGLPNRRLLGERMREAMAAAVEGGTQLAICYLDLDGFKSVNDHLGRAVGDQILIATAARLRDQVRESDTVARLGGDEFVLLMGGFDSLIECAHALDRLVKGLAQPHLVADQELRVTASVGVILYPRDSHDADTLLRHADHAMYQAKQRGRNRVRFFDTVRDRRAHARRSQLERIGEAIECGELCLYYQPKVDMRQGQVVGAEGLVRWRHPSKGLLPPGSFIPLLDGTELQQRLDWWVIGAGLDQVQRWQAQGIRLGLSLNISARSVQHEGFVAELRARLEQHRALPPDTLSLEILESEALGDLDAVANVIERCEDLGVRFALDDFGTGYSSLTYFRRLPAQILKIDQTFVRDMLRSKDDRNIVEGVVGLARAFQREVIAEGVESAAHGLMLLDMGCDRAQGYGIAEPMAPEQIPAWMGHYVSPPLWDLSHRFDWSPGQVLDLLTMESDLRDWVARLLRSAAGASGARPPELAESRCGFGRWYYGEGHQAFGGLATFQELEGLHDALHRQARELLRVRDRGLPGTEETGALIAARDRLVGSIHRLQRQVLSTLH